MTESSIGIETPRLFVWRGSRLIEHRSGPNVSRDPHEVEAEEFRKQYGHIYEGYWNKCPFCGGSYDWHYGKRGKWGGSDSSAVCKRCGFNHRNHVSEGIQDSLDSYSVAFLRSLGVNDDELTLLELCSHLKRQFSDIGRVSSQRFESVVAEIFRSNGDYRVRLTIGSRGGDVVLVEKSTGEQIVVECKRYADGNKVGVGIVRQLVGLMLTHGYKKGKIVTSSLFTSPAIDETKSPHLKILGMTVELIDADGLLRALGNFNDLLPPLNVIDLEKFGTAPGCPVLR